jgi:hypothetical protein
VRYASLTISCTFWVKIINTPFLDSCLINDAFLYRSFSSNGILYFRYCSKVVDHFATLHNMLQKLTSSNIAYLPVWNSKVRTMIVKIVKDLGQCLHKTLDILTVELEHHYVLMFGWCSSSTVGGQRPVTPLCSLHTLDVWTYFWLNLLWVD